MFKSTVFASSRLLLGHNVLLPGQDQPVHEHVGQDKVYVVQEGEGLFTIGDRQESVGPGHAVIAPAGVPHGVRNEGAARLVLLVAIAPGPPTG